MESRSPYYCLRPPMEKLVEDIASCIRFIDGGGAPFKSFRPGVGPYGEPQLLKLISQQLRESFPERYAGAKTCRTPDVLVPAQWRLEFKIVRPFGDNGVEAEHWSQNLLHPYAGNVSAIGDVMKLVASSGPERRGMIVVAYEHDPPQIDVSILVSAFELLARDLLCLPLAKRCTNVLDKLVHPVHQRATVYGWEITSQ